MICADGSQFYYEHGLSHRPGQDGPAVIRQDGYRAYYEHGKRHRPVSEGPVVTLPNGSTEYWENDICLWKWKHERC